MFHTLSVLCLCGAAELGAYLSWTQPSKSEKPLKMHQNSAHTEQGKVASAETLISVSSGPWSVFVPTPCPQLVQGVLWVGQRFWAVLTRGDTCDSSCLALANTKWWGLAQAACSLLQGAPICLTHHSRAEIKASVRQNLRNYCLPSLLVNSCPNTHKFLPASTNTALSLLSCKSELCFQLMEV